MFSFIDPKLGKPLPERSYAEDCTLFTPNDPVSYFRNFHDAVFDEFIVAHLLGWFGKAFLFRDVYISWGWSILFEFCELTFAHILPNFAECWWDQIILDILLCNGIGIWLGHVVMNYLQMKPYNWTGMKHDQDNPPEGFGLLRAFRQLTPRELTPYNWEVFSSARRFFSVLSVFFLAASIELNCFFLKAVFWHPPSHPLVIGRLFMMWLFSLPGLREIYQYISDPNCKRLGTMAWLTVAIIFVENCVWFKFSGDMMAHAKPTPAIVIYSWSAVVIVVLGGALVYFGFYKPMRDRFEAEARAEAGQEAAVTAAKSNGVAEEQTKSPKGIRRRRTSIGGK
jgi:phosphatidylserine synthase 2